MKLSGVLKGGLVLSIVAAVAAGGWWWQQRDDTDTANYRTGKIERGTLAATVSASGAVNPVSLVTVGTQVSGQIRDLLVDFNTEVKAGQLLAQIDPETFEYRVRSAQADVDSARAAVLTSQANALAARANVSRAQADLNEARRNHERNVSLVAQNFISQSEADRTAAVVIQTQETLRSVQAQLQVAEAQIKTAEASVAQRQATLAQAQVDLQRTRIVSPINGIVVKRSIERGQTVAASLQAPELFVIAQNLQDMQVDASVDEADVGRIRTGQNATFTIDAFPGQTFEGTVRQVRKAAVNVNNVVSYVVVVAFSNTSGRLLPGMTANVRVVTDQRDNVLKVPNAALRVRIAGIEPETLPNPSAAPASAPAQAAPGTSTSWLKRFESWLPTAQAQTPPGGPLAAMRDRLVLDLQLSPAQQTKLDQILEQMRPQFAALRELSDEQRATERPKLMGQLRERINAILEPAQRERYASMQAQRGPQARSDATSGAPAQGLDAGPAPATQSVAASADSVGAAAVSAPKAGAGQATQGGSGQGPLAKPREGSGPGVEYRNRLITELRLSEEQAAKMDDFFAEARPKFGALRELPEEARRKAREAIMADIRGRISDVLSAEQKARFVQMQAEAGTRQVTRGRVHVLGADNKPRAYAVRLGITDGNFTELIVSPDSPAGRVLTEGVTVITGVPAAAASNRPASGAAAPRLPF
jgi:HlyD family secretion protein